MDFIVDAQLPKRLCTLLTELGANCIQTLNLPNRNKTSDNAIIEYAEAENRIVIIKDKDFLQSHLLLNKPKKLLLINTGTISNNQLILLFQQHYNYIVKTFDIIN